MRDGRYIVRLTFVEPSLSPGERMFEVRVNGAVVAARLDVAAAAGAARTALVRSYPAEVQGGTLLLELRPVKGAALVSTIEVEAAPAP